MHVYGSSFLSANTKEFCDYVFRNFDKDNNGYIDFKEFLLAIHVTSCGSAEDKLNWAFRWENHPPDNSLVFCDNQQDFRQIIYPLLATIHLKYLFLQILFFLNWGIQSLVPVSRERHISARCQVSVKCCSIFYDYCHQQFPTAKCKTQTF